jgi:hypothetical protein
MPISVSKGTIDSLDSDTDNNSDILYIQEMLKEDELLILLWGIDDSNIVTIICEKKNLKEFAKLLANKQNVNFEVRKK